jgi:hypothetical protein
VKKSDLNKLIDWAENLGYEVFLDKSGGNDICFKTKTIEICSSKKMEERIFILCHECGHIRTESLRGSPHPKGSLKERVKVNRLWNEMISWIEGRRILIELDIPFNEKRLFSYASKCLARYLEAFETQDEL